MLITFLECTECDLGGDRTTEERQAMPVVHSPTLARMWDASPVASPTKMPRYLVPVVNWKPRWSKCVLARSAIAGFTTNINLVNLGKYPLTGPLVSNKLKCISISSNLPPAAASSVYYDCKLIGTVAFNFRVGSNIPIPYSIMVRGPPCAIPSQLTNQ